MYHFNINLSDQEWMSYPYSSVWKLIGVYVDQFLDYSSWARLDSQRNPRGPGLSTKRDVWQYLKVFNFINLFIFLIFFTKQIIWYMYLMHKQIIMFPIFLFPGCPVM